MPPIGTVPYELYSPNDTFGGYGCIVNSELSTIQLTTDRTLLCTIQQPDPAPKVSKPWCSLGMKDWHALVNLSRGEFERR